MASYASIAKGRSTSAPSTKPSSLGPSGATTPATPPVPELAPGTTWADDGESKESAPSVSQASTDLSTAPPTSTNQDQGREPINVAPEVVEKAGNTEAEQAKAPGKQMEPAAESADNHTAVNDVGAADSAEGDRKHGEVSEEATPTKPVYKEAPPPNVNPWAKRAAELKAKAPSVTSPTSATPASATPNIDVSAGKAEPRRRSEQAYTSEQRRNDIQARSRDDPRNKGRREPRPGDLPNNRRASERPRERANSELLPPAPSSETAWPKPIDAIEEDKKKLQLQQQHQQQQHQETDKPRAVSGEAKPHGKTEWTKVPFTPTAVFETRLEGKPSIRMGKGSARPGPSVGLKGSPQNAIGGERQGNIVRVPSLPNGDHGKPAIPLAATRTDREAMPPPASKGSNSEQRRPGPVLTDQGTTVAVNGASPLAQESNGTVAVTPADQSDLNSQAAPFTRRTSPKQHGYQNRRSTIQETPDRRPPGTQTNGTPDIGTDPNTHTPRSNYSERRSEPFLHDQGREYGSFRGPKRGGRKGPRGGFEGPYAAPNPHTAGYDLNPNQYLASPTSGFFPGRGSHGGRGYRNNQGIRSQSIPFDYTRPGQAYQPYAMMQPIQPYVPEYYGPYSAGPYPTHPSAEREMLIATVRAQVEYYFSIDNLLKDIFLRKQMDSQGFIFIQVIASFNRMKRLTTDYEILRVACLSSPDLEIRVGEDGKERVRKATEWEQWVLPMADRAEEARTDGPTELRRPSPVRPHLDDDANNPLSPTSIGPAAERKGEYAFHMQNAAAAPNFFPGAGTASFGDVQIPMEELRGRQAKSIHRGNNEAALMNGFGAGPPDGEPDRFPSSQIETLTVVVRKHGLEHAQRPVPHNVNSRTFSNGSIDSRDVMEEIMKSQTPAPAPATNGTATVNGRNPPENGNLDGQEVNNLTLFWVKDRQVPVDVGGLPSDTTPELYPVLRAKALAQREAAATGTCPYDLDVLYQFWSHFLIRNFNSQMYYEFKTLAAEDAAQRHNDTGIGNLIKYYSEALASQIGIRETIARDYAELLSSEAGKSSRPAFDRLQGAWNDGSINLKNRKKLGDFLDGGIKAELDR